MPYDIGTKVRSSQLLWLEPFLKLQKQNQLYMRNIYIRHGSDIQLMNHNTFYCNGLS